MNDAQYSLPGRGKFSGVGAMQNFNQQQFRHKSYAINTVIGSTDLNINTLSGTAKLAVGWAITPGNGANAVTSTWSLKINNETIFEAVHGLILNPLQSTSDNKFIEIMRALSGTDSITVNVTDTAAQLFYVTFRYI